MPKLSRRCRSTSTCAWSASRTSRSSSGTGKRSAARTATPRTCASSSPCSRLTAPPSSPPSADPRQAAVAAEVVAAGTELDAYAAEIAGCTRCRLAQGRTQVVFGVGNPEAELMFVGEAPGFHEDKQGYPFVGQAGKLHDQLLAGIGLERPNVYIANVLKCRPPAHRDPAPDE